MENYHLCGQYDKLKHKSLGFGADIEGDGR
jgi:hypothetical protein